MYVKAAVGSGMDAILAGGFEQCKLLSIAKIREKARGRGDGCGGLDEAMDAEA